MKTIVKTGERVVGNNITHVTYVQEPAFSSKENVPVLIDRATMAWKTIGIALVALTIRVSGMIRT